MASQGLLESDPVREPGGVHYESLELKSSRGGGGEKRIRVHCEPCKCCRSRGPHSCERGAGQRVPRRAYTIFLLFFLSFFGISRVKCLHFLSSTH